MERLIYGFNELRKEDSEKVGKKCANLGELTGAGFRVPPGFAVSLDAYSRFMRETGLIARIEEFLATLALDTGSGFELASVRGGVRGHTQDGR